MSSYRTFRGDTWTTTKNWTLANIYKDPNALIFTGGKFTVFDLLGTNTSYTGENINRLLVIEEFTDKYGVFYSAAQVLENGLKMMAQMESVNLLLGGRVVIRGNREGVFYRNQEYVKFMIDELHLKPATKSYHFAALACDFDEEGVSAEGTRKKLDGVWPFRMELGTQNWVHLDMGQGTKRFKP